MGKKEANVHGWDNLDDAIGVGDVTILADDADSVRGIPHGLPTGAEGEYMKKPTFRIFLPLATTVGMTVLVIGKRTYRRMRSMRDKAEGKAFLFVRHGVKGDADTSIAVSLVDPLPAELETVKETELKDVDELKKSVMDKLLSA